MSSRETVLAWSTLAVLLGVATYFLGESKVQEWKEILKSQENTEREIVLSERLIGQREVWQKRLDDALQHIDAHPLGVEVTPQLMESIEQFARQNNLHYERLSPDKETSVGDIFEVSIKCEWTGDLESIIRFLYSLSAEGGKYKVRSLTITPTGRSALLKGQFVVDCAYTRIAVDTDEPLRVTPVSAP